MKCFQILTLVSDKAIIDVIDNLGVSPASASLSILGSPINIRGTKCEMQGEVRGQSGPPVTVNPLPPPSLLPQLQIHNHCVIISLMEDL